MDDTNANPSGTQSPVEFPSSQHPDMTYEETPILTPVVEQSPPSDATPQQEPPKKRSGFLGFVKGAIFFIVLFVIGFALSGLIRNLLNSPPKIQLPITAKPSITPPDAPQATEIGLQPEPYPSETKATTPSATISNAQYILNGTTRKPYEEIQLQLPNTVLPLVCDGSACGSQGTYLPGGTRFTVALRGAGQVLADFRGKIISDAGGKAFTTKATTVAGKPAMEFTNITNGSTIGGYAFSQMRGYMIEVSDTLSLEINHFSPSGIAADFASDETVFNAIVNTLVFTGNTKGSVIPIPSLLPTTPPTL